VVFVRLHRRRVHVLLILRGCHPFDELQEIHRGWLRVAGGRQHGQLVDQVIQLDGCDVFVVVVLN
jgi:hypothetical protein